MTKGSDRQDQLVERGEGCFGHSAVAPDNLDRLRHELDTLNQRWNDRLTSKDFRALGESYTKGRISLLLYFKHSKGSIMNHGLEITGGGLAVDTDTIVVHLINEFNAVKFIGNKDGQHEIVLVDVVSLANFPNSKTSTLVRLYRAKEQACELGKCFHYSTVLWRFRARFIGRLEGLAKCVPRLMDREICSAVSAVTGAPKARGNVVEGAIHVVEGIPDAKQSFRWKWLRSDAVDFSSLRVVLHDKFAEVSLGEALNDVFELIDVAVGPFDL